MSGKHGWISLIFVLIFNVLDFTNVTVTVCQLQHFNLQSLKI